MSERPKYWISKKNWKMSFKKWHMENKYRGTNYYTDACGYCNQADISGDDCGEACYLANKWTVSCSWSSKSPFKRYQEARTEKTQKKYADIIFNDIKEHGEQLGYDTTWNPFEKGKK